MSQFQVIGGGGHGGLRYGVFEIRESVDGGSREVARFYHEAEAAAYAGWRAGHKAARPEGRAESARDKIAGLHMVASSPENPERFSEGRIGTSVNPPTQVAPVPIIGEDCCYCEKKIQEGDSWRPDPEAAVFTRIHTACLALRGREEVQ